MSRFKLTAQRRKMIDLLVRGHTYVSVARALGISRNTITANMKRPEMRERLLQRHTEWIARTNLRRLHEMTVATDHATKIAFIQLREAAREDDPKLTTVRRTRQALRMWRKQVRATRKELDSSFGQVAPRPLRRKAAELPKAPTARSASPKASSGLLEASEQAAAPKERSADRKRLASRTARL